MNQYPTFNDVKDVFVKLSRKPELHESGIFYVQYEGVLPPKKWFGQWYNLDISGAIEIDSKDYQSVCCCLEPKKVSHLKSALNKIKIHAWPTGYFFPSFLYMDTLPYCIYSDYHPCGCEYN